MAWSASADPVDFSDALAWFRKRVAMTRADFARLTAAAKRKAFTVSNVAQLDLVNHALKAIDDAVAKGTSLEDFKKDIGGQLKKAWSGTVEDPPWRLETIFRTNVQLAYGAGRYKQATHPDVVDDRPVWMFDAILDGRTSEICSSCDHTKRPADDPWWGSHTPPLHFNCRSSFIALTEKQSRLNGGITARPPGIEPDDGFGLSPKAEEWEPDTSQYPAPLRSIYEAKQKSAPPPPPPPQLTDGVHFEKLTVSGGAKDQVDDLLAGIGDPETLDYLTKKPLAELRFAPTLARGSNGRYWYAGPHARQLEVATARSSASFGRPWQPGQSWSVSSSATTQREAERATLRHEIGHHIHLGDSSKAVNTIVAAAFAKAKKASRFITQYAKSNADEYFAESYVAYYLRRSDLRQQDPNGYMMVEAVLRERGILP